MIRIICACFFFYYGSSLRAQAISIGEDSIIVSNYSEKKLSKGDAIVWNGKAWEYQKLNLNSFSIPRGEITSKDLTDSTFYSTRRIQFESSENADLIVKTKKQELLRVTKSGQLGFGINNPLTDVHVRSKNPLILEGELGKGNFSNLGKGTRMMWIPARAAFRVGKTTGDQWSGNKLGEYSFAGGLDTKATGRFSFAFGDKCSANANHATAFGGRSVARGKFSFAAGAVTKAMGYAAVAMGRASIATDSCSIALGYHTHSRGHSSVALGYQTKAEADHSFALGYRARSLHKGCFVFADYSTRSPLNSSRENQFAVRAAGGTYFYTSSDLSTGVFLAPGESSWSSLQNEDSKENKQVVDLENILEKISNVSIHTWNYKGQEKNNLHIGPSAKDFHQTFGLGQSERAINSNDIDGVNMAALVALTRKTEVLLEKEKEVIELRQTLFSLEEEKRKLEQRLLIIEKKVEEYLNRK